ncbi:MAG: cytochrome b [Hyphomicrobiaceae bacterium]
MPETGKSPQRMPGQVNGSGKVIHLVPRVYAPMARMFHWITVGFIVLMYPLGLYMTYRGNTLNVWDGLTNGLYSTHKLLGFLLFWLILARLVYRVKNGAPPDEPTLEPWQRLASHITHWSLYGLLVLVPLMGWIGISLYPARDIFGLFQLPALWTPNQPASETVFFIHKALGKVMLVLIFAHIGAALFHHLIRKDGVLRRMLPTKS